MKYNFCLCCGKPLNDEEIKIGYHKKCLKSFFGQSKVPSIELDDKVLENLAKKSSDEGITVAGVQKKISLHLISDKTESRLTLIGYPQGYILKPQSSEFQYLPETEFITMNMADKVGIKTVPHALIYINDKDLAYITKRIDRSGRDSKIHMEDFCQLSQRLTEDKYKGSYEQCTKIIQTYSSRPGLDISDFFYRLLFCFVTGNSDMHLKNFSLIKDPQSKEHYLSEAYDLLPVNLLMPSDTEECALNLNGKKSRLKKIDFLNLAQNAQIPAKAAEKMIGQIISKKEVLLQLAACPLISKELSQNFCNLIKERIERLEG